MEEDMIRLYVYCSYKFSPVGFQLGIIDCTEGIREKYLIPKKKSNVIDFIPCFFEEGLIQKSYGYIPERKTYLFLQKKLSGVSQEDASVTIYINFAFEFDDYNKYYIFKCNFDRLSIEEQAQKCALFIVPDKSVDFFALKVDRERLDDFISEMQKNLNSLPLDKHNECKEKLFIDSISSNDYSQKLNQTIGMEFSKTGEKQYCYPAQKESSQKKKMLLIAAIFIVILLVLLILR